MKILFLSCGDAENPKSWSNVPYLFLKTLRSKGYDVITYNIDPNKYLTQIFDWLVCKPLRLIYRFHTYQFIRSSLFLHWNNLRLRKIFRRHADSDLAIIMNFDFYNKWNDVPTLLFHDWTYLSELRDHLKRRPFFFEKALLNFQDKALNNAQYVVSLFPACARQIKKDFPQAHVYSLGNNVINSLYEGEIDANQIILEKQQSQSILFIGSLHYLKAANHLVEAVKLIHKTIPSVKLDIIGLSNNNFKNLPDYVHAYGYLNKNVAKENELYYRLLFRARVIANPDSRWAGYSSMIEGMYYYTPVAVSPYPEFVEEFGNNIDFGKYFTTYSVDNSASTLEDLLLCKNEQYRNMCNKAHKSVENYTWSAYVSRLMALVSSKSKSDKQ